MADEKKTGEETKVTGENQDTGTGAAGQGQNNGENTVDDQGKRTEVPIDVLKAIRDENKTLKDQLQLYRAQLQSFAQNAPAFQPQNAPQGVQIPANQNQDTGDIKFDIDDDDVVTGAELRKILKSLKNTPAGDPQVNAKIAHIETVLRMNQIEPDWNQTINKYLPELIQSDPEVWGIIQHSPNPIKAALMFAKTSPKYAKDHANAGGGAPPNGDDLAATLERMIQNAGKPAGGAAGGSGGAGGTNRFESMTDAEFEAHMDKVISGRT